MKKTPKQGSAAKFKEPAVKRTQDAGVGVAAREPRLVAQTLRGWVTAAADKPTAPGAMTGHTLAARPAGQGPSSGTPRAGSAALHRA